MHINDEEANMATIRPAGAEQSASRRVYLPVRKSTLRLFLRGLFCAALVSAVLIPAPAAQTVATGRLMREKLGHAQKVLEAIMTSNYLMLDRESSALAKITDNPAWMVLKTPEYRRYSAAFMRAAQGLEAAAKDRDFDAARE